MQSQQVTVAPRSPANTLGEHIRRTLMLALPVTVARVGILAIVAVDIAMTGHAGTDQLAYYGLAMAPQVVMLIVGIGLLMGTVVLTAQADGAEHSAECGAVWRISLVHALAIGVVFMLLCQAGEWFLALFGQAPDLARGAGGVLAVIGWSMPAILLHTATVHFLEGINRPAPGMVVILFANLINGALNWLFVYGNWGLPAMGAEGAALGTAIVRWFMFLALAGYALTRVDRERYGIAGKIAGARDIGRRLRRIGYPMGLSHGLESSSFAAMTMFAGLLGPVEVGGYQVAMNLMALAFMVALGFATAASVRVGNAVGRHDRTGLRLAGWVAVGLAVLALAAIGVVYHSLPGGLAAIYTSDEAVAAVAVPTIAVAAAVLVFDGGQGVCMGALRAAADVWPATVLYLFSFWLVMVPLGYVMGVVHGGGAPALMVSVGVGCATAVTLLGLRFHLVSRRAVARS